MAQTILTTTLLLLLFISAAIVDAAARAPAADCSTVTLPMADCLSYVAAGSTVKKPEGTCCSGLKTVLKTDAHCLCEALKNRALLGVRLNVAKAMGLSQACKINAPSAITNCGMSLGTGMNPAGFTKKECPQCGNGVGAEPSYHVLNSGNCSNVACEMICKRLQPPNTKLVCVRCETHTCNCCAVH